MRVVNSDGGSGAVDKLKDVTVGDNLQTREMFYHLYQELKIMNMHLATITNMKVNELDIVKESLTGGG